MDCRLRVETADSPFTSRWQKAKTYRAPMAHAEANRNGAIDNIAGILSENRLILGMMPHPEDLVDPLMGGTDGLPLFESIAGVFATA